jgi:hypothetical protein
VTEKAYQFTKGYSSQKITKVTKTEMLKFSNLRYLPCLLFKMPVSVAFVIFCFNSLLPTANR